MSRLREEAERRKAEGNRHFLNDELGSAILSYSEAIRLCPAVPTFYTNRALCYKKRSEWSLVEADCKQALSLDRESLKGHYMLGLAHLHYKRFAEAIRELEKALDLARGSKAGLIMVDEIWAELAKAKYTQWQVDSISRREKQNRLRDHLKTLMAEDFEAHKKRILEGLSPKSSSKQPQTFGLFGRLPAFLFPSEDSEEGSVLKNQTIDPEPSPQVLALESALSTSHAEALNTFENVFEAAGAPDRPGEVPDHLCCPITMDVFRDPVITPAGVSYERSVLLQHFKRGKNFDPVTRLPMDETQMYPNLGLREAVQQFLEGHGWAFQPPFY